jgi:alpha-D-xyloside xylohydrolase
MDVFNPEARRIRWEYMKDVFFGFGTDAWWQDATEPGDQGDALPGRSTYLGSGNRMRNAYPLFASRAAYEGQLSTRSDKRFVNLTRSAFPGQQRYASASWSGDIAGDWVTLRKQIPAGLNFCAAGIPYWTTDTGGFFRPKDQHTSPEYNELLVRWFQWSTFTPILRVHGYESETEIWKFPLAELELRRYLDLRYRMLPYNYSMSWMVARDGYTQMRALPFDFPEDRHTHRIDDEYMFGPAFLVCPVTTPNVVSRPVYLPRRGYWFDFWTGMFYQGGRTVDAAAPISTIPLFVPAGSIVPLGPTRQYSGEKPADPIEIRVYAGVDGEFILYEDEGDNYDYEQGAYATIPFRWDESSQTLVIGDRSGAFSGMLARRTFNIVWVTQGHGIGLSAVERPDVTVEYAGRRIDIKRP